MDRSIEAEAPIARQLAGYVTALAYEDLPEKAVAHAKALVLDQFACQLAGSTMPWIAPALRLVELAKGANPESTIVNYGFRLPASDAAFANATFGHACEMDDSAFGSSGHIGSAAVPVALAMGEPRKISGRQFLLSIIAGYEIMYRLMQSVTPHNIERGFQSHGIGGPFASATVAGKILGLDREQMTHAIAIAGSHAAGPAEYDQSGGEVKRIHAGMAARSGINSALLAKFGLTGPPTIIEGKRGFCNLFAAKSDPSRITDGLGQTFNICNASFKMFPAVGGAHTPIAAVQLIVKEHHITPAQVDWIDIGLAPKRMLHGGAIGQPYDVASAQFSIAFSVALTFCRGTNRLENYADPTLWSDKEIVEVMCRVNTYPDALATGDKINRAKVVIRLKDGRSVEAVQDYPRGTPPNPASREEHYAKVRNLCGRVLSAKRTDALIQTVEDLEHLPSVSDLTSLLVGTTSKNDEPAFTIPR